MKKKKESTWYLDKRHLDKLQRVSQGGFALFRRAAPVSGPNHCTVGTPKARNRVPGQGRAGQDVRVRWCGTGTSQVPSAPGTWSVPQMPVPPTRYIDRRPFLDIRMITANMTSSIRAVVR